jgi:tRNA threonylcarbamoyl adenosine modification protein (Sua5/YciO/YrdC/YwlC family)
MERIYDCSVDTSLLEGMRKAKLAIGRGELVVIPTDTVYGLAADAFNAAAVQALLDSKGRGRQSPPPVLIPNVDSLYALAESVSDRALMLAEKFWPGPLTIVVRAQPSLQWDLGETKGTVALRVPNNKIALALLAETGPLAVSSANLTGEAAATSVTQAFDYLGEKVAVYLDGGPAEIGEASTILDLTGEKVRIIRAGALGRAELADLLGEELSED